MKTVFRKTLGFKIIIIGAISLLFGVGEWLVTKKFFVSQPKPVSGQLISVSQAPACYKQVIGENQVNTHADLFVNCGGFLE